MLVARSRALSLDREKALRSKMLSVLAGLPGMAQPWDIRRFAQTAIFFNAPEDVLKRLAPPNPFLKPNVIGKDGLVWSSTNRMLEFGPLDDVVMGGVSQSSFAITPAGIGKFQGEVSTENNGGFAGVRSKALTPALQLGSFQGLKLRVKGDGSRYKFIVRDSYDWNGIAWSQSFDTTPEVWQECLLPFDDFVPTLFAKSVTGKRLNKDAINTFQITLSKFEYDGELNPAFKAGPFELLIESIAVM